MFFGSNLVGKVKVGVENNSNVYKTWVLVNCCVLSIMKLI